MHMSPPLGYSETSTAWGGGRCEVQITDSVEVVLIESNLPRVVDQRRSEVIVPKCQIATLAIESRLSASKCCKKAVNI